MAEVTAILLSWRRPENMRHILDALREQSEPPEILLINNGGFQTFGVERTVHIPWNAGPWIRIPFAVHATTPYVMLLDDDLMPTDAAFVRDMRQVAELRRDALVGTHGRKLGAAPNYYTNGRDTDGWVEVVKARCMMFHRSVLDRVRLLNANRPLGWTHEDIWLSLEVGHGRQANWAEGALRERVQELPAPYAVSRQAGHWEQRDAAVSWHLDRLALDDVLDRSETIPHLCTREEMRHLWTCAMKAPEYLPMIECGCYEGSSAVALADAAYKRGSALILIDRFRYRTVEYGANGPEVVQANLAQARVPVAVRIVESDSTVVPEGVDQVGFLHIDTDHRAEYLNKELDVWLPHMAPGSVIAFHDYCDNSPEMAPVIDARLGDSPEWEPLGLVRWMIAFQKVGGDA